MFVFLSHCVRKGDPAKLFKEKDSLIASLESHGHTVFDYAERPGGELNWVSEIRIQLHACDVMVYFAKKWPETRPGVCVLELSAAKMWSKPVVFFRPSRLGGFNGQRIFGKAFGGLSDSVHVGQDLVHFEIDSLVQCLAAISASRPASPLSLSMESLDELFLRTKNHFWPNLQSNNVDRFNKFLGFIKVVSEPEQCGGQSLCCLNIIHTTQPVSAITRASNTSILAFKSVSDNTSQILPFDYQAGTWNSGKSIELPLGADQINQTVFTAGLINRNPVAIWCRDGRWHYCDETGDKEIEYDGDFAVRRTCLFESASRVCFFADGEAYEVDADNKRVVQTDVNVTQIPAPYFASPADDAPPRISGVEGLPNSFAMISGGRVEAFSPGLPDRFGGLQLSNRKLQLGQWDQPDYRALLMTFHAPEGKVEICDFDRIRKSLDLVPVATTWELKNWPSLFEWLLRKANVQLTTAGLWFNQNRDSPVCYLTDICSEKRILPEFESGYHRFELSLSSKRRNEVWKALGTGKLSSGL